MDGTARIGTLLLVQIVSEYCRCVSQFPVIAPQLALYVIDLLRTFNLHSRQLAIGASALHVADLTNKVLAIVSDLLTGQMTSWNDRPTVPSQLFHNVSRQIVKLHDVIAAILPSKQVATIY